MTARYSLVYSLLFIGLSWVNVYPEWLKLPPASIHQWRQADGQAIVWHYTQKPGFSNASICNLFAHGDAHAMGEWPGLYWLAGMIDRHVDSPDYPLRWVGLLFLFWGGWALGWLFLQNIRHPLPAASGAILVLSAPILSYYGPSFLPDATALCSVFVMAACLFRADQSQQRIWLWLSGGWAALAILLKISSAILPLALLLAWVGGRLRNRFALGSVWAGNAVAQVAAALFAVVVWGRWWIHSYNARHHAGYFLSGTRPVWRYDSTFIGETLGMVLRDGLPVYASAGLYVAVGAALYWSIKHWRTTPFWWRYTLIAATAGSVGYFLLWFRMFREHDYYALCLLILPALVLWNGFRAGGEYLQKKKGLFALGLCLLLGGGHSGWVMHERLALAYHPPTVQSLPPAAFLSPGDLSAMGIPEEARFFCPDDPSPNISLLALRHEGWSGYNFGRQMPADTLARYQTLLGLTHLAVRDTARLNPVYRKGFPVPVSIGPKGWFIYKLAEK